MKSHLLHLGPVLFAGLLAGCAEPYYETPQVPPPPPPAPAEEPAQAPEPYPASPSAAPPSPASEQAETAPAPPSAPPPAQAAPPAAAPLVYSYPTGQWVYLTGRGWVWIPAGTATQEVDGAPYAYLYTPAYGWTWYLSPWGWGPYRYGGWVRHPWHPGGWHGYWVAHPHVVVRLGHGHFRR